MDAKKNSKKIALLNDERLLCAASYYESKGTMVTLRTTEQLLARFREFKGLVKRGSYTVEQIEEKVYSRYGIVNVPTTTLDDMLSETDKMYKELRKREQNGQEEKREK